MKRQRQTGHVSTECIVISTAMVIALFVPWDGEQSAMAMLVQGVQSFFSHGSYVLSLP